MNSSYETVAASQTDQILGPSAGEHAGDFLDTLIIVPATTSPGAVQIQDGAGTEITVFPGGASSVTELKPLVVRLGIRSRAGSWKVTTGANVSVVAIGDFT
jgi:hypothetical protein